MPTGEKFKKPEKSIGNLSASVAAIVVLAASDIALVLDDDGIVVDHAVSDDLALADEIDTWIGRPFTDIVTVESRPKIEEMRQAFDAGSKQRWRQINHPRSKNSDLPIAYRAVQLEDSGRTIFLGRDMSGDASMQQRLVEAQLTMERDYARMRSLETRYKHLLKSASDAILTVEGASGKVLEANASAAKLLSVTEKRLVGRHLRDALSKSDPTLADRLMEKARNAGNGNAVELVTDDSNNTTIFSAQFIRQETSSLFVIRAELRDESLPASSEKRFAIEKLFETVPDGVVLTERDGQVYRANQSFLDLAEISTEDQACQYMIDRWLGRGNIDFKVIRSNLGERSHLQNFATTLSGESGRTTNVEISAVEFEEAGKPSFGFIVRNVDRRLAVPSSGQTELPRSPHQLAQLIGRLSMKQIVRETTDEIERMCIEAALKLTGENRASAAELLGMSRQSFYVKLRHHGIGEKPDSSNA